MTHPEYAPLSPAAVETARDTLVRKLRWACWYENLTKEVRKFQSSATNGLVVDAADEIDRLTSELAIATAEIDRLRSEIERLQENYNSVCRAATIDCAALDPNPTSKGGGREG